MMESESSTSQSDDENPTAKDGSRKPEDKKRETREPGPKKRLAECPGATSSGSVLPPIPSLKDDTDEVNASPSKRTRRTKPPLDRADAFDACNCGDDSNHAVSCPMRHLQLKDESVANEPQPPGVSKRVTSATELEQSPKMSHVPIQSSEVHPTSPKVKGLYDRAKEFGHAVGNLFTMSPKRKSDKKGSSSEKADLKLKQKSPKGKPQNRNPAKSEASSSSSSPKSKKGDSSLDRSLPSTSSSNPNVEYPRRAKKSPHKSKSGAESSSASTSDDSRRRGETLTASSGEGSKSPSRKSRSRSRRPECDCNRTSDYEQHLPGCAQRAWDYRNRNNSSCRNNYDPSIFSHYYGSSASDPNVEFSRATRSASKSKKTVSPRVSTPDPSQPGTSRCLTVPSSGNSPNSSDEAARSPNRRSPSKSPSQRPHRQPSPSKCNCSERQKRGGKHKDDCPFRSPSTRR